MLSNKSWGIAGAAMLGTAALLGANAANAVITIDNGRVGGSVSYAKETLVTLTAELKDDLEGYYLLEEAGDADHNVTVPGVAYNMGDSLRVDVVLTNLKLGADVAEADAISLPTGVAGDLRAVMNDLGSSTPSFAFEPGVDSPADSADAAVTINLGDLAIAAGSESGSISVTVVNRSDQDEFGGEFGITTASFPNAVKVVKGLVEGFEGNDVVAAVAEKFLLFADSAVYASLGTLQLGVKADVRNAVGGALIPVTPEGLEALITVVEEEADESSALVVSGDFSFTNAAWFEAQDRTESADGDCSGGVVVGTGEGLDMDQRVPAEDDGFLRELASQNVSDFTARSPMAMVLCISVRAKTDDMATAINAGTYSVETKYKATPMQANTPMSGTHELGTIVRDGTTVQLPYLTTREGYVQRIRIMNRGGPATYSLALADNAEGGVEEDTLAMGRTTLMVSDLVMIDEGNTTSGTLIIESEKSNIDVATTLNTPGSTDTVIYMKE